LGDVNVGLRSVVTILRNRSASLADDAPA